MHLLVREFAERGSSTQRWLLWQELFEDLQGHTQHGWLGPSVADQASKGAAHVSLRDVASSGRPAHPQLVFVCDVSVPCLIVIG